MARGSEIGKKAGARFIQSISDSVFDLANGGCRIRHPKRKCANADEAFVNTKIRGE